MSILAEEIIYFLVKAKRKYHQLPRLNKSIKILKIFFYFRSISVLYLSQRKNE